jgi:hypothetical protein
MGFIQIFPIVVTKERMLYVSTMICVVTKLYSYSFLKIARGWWMILLVVNKFTF